MTRKAKGSSSRSHESATVESLRHDPVYAATYLDGVLEDGTQEEVMLALRRVSEAFGGVQKLAAKSRLNPTSLYRTLSAAGNPELRSVRALLNAMGMRLAVQPIKKTASRSAG